MKKIFNIAIIASGNGTNAQSIINACGSGILATFARVVVIVSNNSRAGVVKRAIAHEIPFYHVSEKKYGINMDRILVSILQEEEVDLVLLAGYMKKINKRVIRQFPDSILNIHPALLPKHGGKGMYGLKVHESVIAAKDTLTGVTVHLVNEEYDAGDIVEQIQVPVHENETAEELQKRVLIYEHVVYPDAVLKLIKERSS